MSSKIDRHVYLCGIKHSGKSSLARAIAPRLGVDWVDLDDLVLAAIAPYQTIREFFRQQGSEAFMAEERRALECFLASCAQPSIIALGGGACDNTELMAQVSESGLSIYLEVDEEQLYRRIITGGVPPFLNASDPRSSFAMLYRRRHGLYSQLCDILIQLPDSADVERAATLVIDRLSQEE
jgi:shikimate kinase